MISVSPSDKEVSEFNSLGCIVVPGVLDPDQVKVLRAELDAAMVQDLEAHPDRFDAGMVHNCMFRGEHMAKLLNNETLNAYTQALLAPHCIVYAYQSSSLPPAEGNYGSRVHVDSPRFIPGYSTNLGVIFPLDDFREENGATYYLPRSHLSEEIPEDDVFYREASRIVAFAGDMILFSGRLVHAAGINKTDKIRHSLTINLCRHYMRQRFDFPAMADESFLKLLDENGRRMIGMNVRMPKSLDEFYLPPEERLYKPGQE